MARGCKSIKNILKEIAQILKENDLLKEKMSKLEKQVKDHETRSELMQLRKNMKMMIPGTDTLVNLFTMGKSSKEKKASD